MRKTDVPLLHEYNISYDSRELFLITDDEINATLAGQFLKNLRILEHSNKPIIIHQFNVGGDWSAGMAIYDAILHSPCKFVFVCYGYAASMGSVIPQAVANKGYRITLPNCEWLIHEGEISLESNSRSATSQIEQNTRVLNKMYEIYAGVCQNGEFFQGDKLPKIKSYLKRKLSSKEDWWLTGQEAVHYGFADAVLGSKDYETIDKIKGYL